MANINFRRSGLHNVNKIKFAAATSVSRIKWHLSQVRGRGVAIYSKVPEDDQEAAYKSFLYEAVSVC